MRRRMGYGKFAAAGVLVAVGGFVGFTPHAGADVITPAGGCEATGIWQDAGFTETSGDHVPSDVIEIPQADTVSWAGSVGDIGDTGPEREISGEVLLDLPIGTATLDDWGGPSSRYANADDYEYDLPDFVIGIELNLHGAHREDGDEVCSGSVGLIVAGGTFDNPLAFVGLLGMLLFGGGLAFAGKGGGHGVLGAVMGLLFGLMAALSLLVFGVLPLNSILVAVVPVLLLVLGAVWGKMALIGGAAAAA